MVLAEEISAVVQNDGKIVFVKFVSWDVAAQFTDQKLAHLECPEKI